MWLEMDALKKRNQFLEAENQKAKNQADERSTHVRRLELALSALIGAISASSGLPLDYEDVRRICSTFGITELKNQFDENMSTDWYALDMFPPDISGLLKIIEELSHRAATAVAFSRRAIESGRWGDVESAIYALDYADNFLKIGPRIHLPAEPGPEAEAMAPESGGSAAAPAPAPAPALSPEP